MDAIFSFRPHFAEAILDGSKTIELRTVAPSKPVDRIWIYATSPIMKIVGHFRPGSIRHAVPEDCEKALIESMDLKRYFAIEILEPTTLEPAINPRDMGLPYIWLSAQSWRYAGKLEQAELRRRAP